MLQSCGCRGASATHLDGHFLLQFQIVLHGVVAHTNAAELPLGLELLQRFVRGNMLTGHGPVHKVEVKVVGLEVRQGLVNLSPDGLLAGVDGTRPHFRGKEELVPGHARLLQRVTNHRLIVVKLGAIKEPVAGRDGILRKAATQGDASEMGHQ